MSTHVVARACQAHDPAEEVPPPGSLVFWNPINEICVTFRNRFFEWNLRILGDPTWVCHMRASVPETAEIQHFGRRRALRRGTVSQTPIDGRTRNFRQPNRADPHLFTGLSDRAPEVLNARAKKVGPTRSVR